MNIVPAAAAAALLALGLNSARADGPSDYVYMPGVEYGERELDFKFGSSGKSRQNRHSAASLGLGVGISEHWFTEINLKYERLGADATQYDAFEWENKFQFAEPGRFPVDVGLIIEIERSQDHAEGYEVRFGPLLQTEFGKLQLNGNLLFERHFRADQDGHMEMAYQWQLKYRWLREFEFGLQGFGELGKWNDPLPSDEQSHRMGPAVFGKLYVGNGQALSWNLAYLAGITRAAPDRNLRMQVEYEF
ncbi:MAG: hypothetical protein JNJ60_13205 [Rhodocyclaceae bacterium]|nr:hypothetical protein [Rhodocyclaceae bacterium]